MVLLFLERYVLYLNGELFIKIFSPLQKKSVYSHSTMTRVVDVVLVGSGVSAYLFSYFFRGTIAPITDVFEKEFRATSSEVFKNPI